MEITELKVMVKDVELNIILHEIRNRLEKIESMLSEKQLSPNQLNLPLETAPEQKTKKKKKTEEPKTEEPKTEEPKTEEENEEQYTESEVRAFLAGLIKTGKQPQVKTLLTDFGVQKLSDIPAERYSEVMKKAATL